MSGRKSARVEAAPPPPGPATGPGSSRIAALAERSTASAVLAGGGGTARLLAGAGSYTASSLAGAEAEAIGSELLRRPRGRATQEPCALLYLVSRSDPASPDNSSLSAERRGDYVRASWLYS